MVHKVLLVDDDDALLEALCQFYEIIGQVKCLKFTGLQDLMQRHTEVLGTNSDGIPPQETLAIVDINLGYGKPTGIDVYHWLQEQNYEGRIVFLTGHAKDHALVREASIMDHIPIYEKPLAFDQLTALVKEN
jgi:FixJ family two-component response regulator